MTRYTLCHRTAYRYGRSVDLASHLLHLTPRTLPGQVVRAAGIAVTPEGGRRTDGADHFGNGVTWLFLGTPHDAFEVVLEAEVEVHFPPPPSAVETLPWEQVRAAAQAASGWDAAEFALPSGLAPAERAAGVYAAQSFPPGRPVLQGLRELTTRIRRDFAFKAGVTTISTPVSQILSLRAGVCQDFAHLMIAGLRALGLPARYVSGYVRTRPPPGQARRQGADQSHAWVGCWMGPAHGWVDLDPTNDLVVSDEHLVLGWGRDFADVSPVTGILLGGGRQRLSVSVDLIAD
ncbi:transglutaminase family protein [Falsiroseomonas selenitidurans]|uniref:Transglutaminase family protein n=1 Tax=Falsiroseomonas selenitidurans TaxID=2716335 RepID=A0ABX1E547_9PROT|nr:transglutaminase family protein [Falsiroseomonas selenitidurans]NKC30897.1 transglutaminase family protein [Falsiroseomonas selenitidurans]